jgi:hypothetical protein
MSSFERILAQTLTEYNPLPERRDLNASYQRVPDLTERTAIYNRNNTRM